MKMTLCCVELLGICDPTMLTLSVTGTYVYSVIGVREFGVSVCCADWSLIMPQLNAVTRTLTVLRCVI